MAALDTRTDNFDDNSLAAIWTADTSGGGTVTEQNQRLEIAGASNGQYAAVQTPAGDDLTGSYVYVKVSNWQSGDYSTLEVVDASGDYYFLQVSSGGVIFLKKNIGGVDQNPGSGSQETYSATTHAWWRIRESGGVIYGDTAPSSAADPPAPGDWTNRWSDTVDAGFDKTSVRALLAHYSGAASRVTYFDGFNTGTGSGGGGGGTWGMLLGGLNNRLVRG